MKEKTIENEIKEFLVNIGGYCEGLQGGKILIKKGGKTYRMTLQSDGAPDIICFYKGVFLAIETKKNQDEVDKWKKLEARYIAGEDLPASYEREVNQIKTKIKIINNGGVHFITCDINEIILYIKKIENETL